MTAEALSTQRFTRRTTLARNEYHKNFHKIDEDTIATITSVEADAITPLMSKIYLRLQNAPREFWNQRGELHFTAQVREGKLVKASTILCDYLGVARATVCKALQWMHKTGVIGYFAGKNGVGIRIFINRATSSIGARPTTADQKNLQFPDGSSEARHGSANEPTLKDSLAISEISDTDLIRHAPKNGAKEKQDDESFAGAEIQAVMPQPDIALTEAVVKCLTRELMPSLKSAAAQAASQAAAREHERTRQWLDQHGLPKAARVAQREAYQIFKHQGGKAIAEQRALAELQVGRSIATYSPPAVEARTPDEIAEIAEMCLTMLDVQGKPVEQTLTEIDVNSGGWLLPESIPKVRQAAGRMLLARSQARGSERCEP